ncbi:aromatic amino acid hydroxylase [Aureibaculum sp. 2210JD6-5]|uniref:aromatic amino acid hydroxylase n=1 Tax=Aureibaculum sp. 2210JD6-5 TaxID=3103957 RepID=UPI002AAE82E4|nr:aromatic amino acid hydroxylase [Aureibaculum sp. 2210JD6-5]MDY7395963.1 aromatic amino acid hydroxylase [Aureibaculum sp. 2210JD6-5]
MNFKSNKIIARLPKHLQSFVIRQPYNEYTAQNQAVWRYVMRKNIDYLAKVAHESYIPGLAKAGISVDTIPRMQGMNRILKELGWAAVSVDGFIPPNAFMEFQAYNALVIAADIRTIDHIEYTPAPDIIHEAAGHAPIIANPEYAEYLRRFGEIGSKAISSGKDYELYEAIRHLSIIKEDPNTNKKDIAKADKKVAEVAKSMTELSEMAKIRNLHWWTVEYGLIGTLENPKIYGAGLLSSIGESQWCMSENVKKVPYTIEAADTDFDITKPQPQLFVTPDFAHLSMVLEEYANKMALRNGGLMGIKKLIDSKNLGTIELSTGIQISGNFDEVISDENNKPVYFKTIGPTALAYKNKELIGHSKTHHADGFGSPVGKLKGINIAIEDMSPTDLEAYGIYEGKVVSLKFEGQISVTGEIITGKRNLQGKIILISFKNCTVKHKDKLLFHPDWGIYDMAVGKEVVSAYSGVADAENFGLIFEPPKEKTHKITYAQKDKKLHGLYQEVRKMREKGKLNHIRLEEIFILLKLEYPSDWLLPLEIAELVYEENSQLKRNLINYLETLAENKEIAHLIKDGVELLEKDMKKVI